MKVNRLTPNTVILRELGQRLVRIRKQMGFSQAALADEAGIGVATVRRIEDGSGGQLSSWLKILKTLGMESAIDALLPETFQSPMAEILSRKKRVRRGAAHSETGSAVASGAEGEFIWGDETP